MDAVSQPPSGPSLRIPDAPAGSEPTSPSTTSAMARFEFEMGRGNEGTKVLMVEWNPTAPGDNPGDTPAPADTGAWDVSWDGKADTFALGELDGHGPAALQRVYFLLPSGVAVPPAVTIKHLATGRTLATKCMPAIFAPGLGLGMGDAGKRGVLHTIWAKRRVGQLQDEIRGELLDNSESIGLEMAVQEREWIIEHFGLMGVSSIEHNASSHLQHLQQRETQKPAPLQLPAGIPAMQSPKTPTSARMAERLKGLKLATSPGESSGSGSPSIGSAATARMSPARPPQPASGMGMASLDAMVDSGQATPSINPQTKETEDELFALPMSPRSPEMKTSPFSFLK